MKELNLSFKSYTIHISTEIGLPAAVRRCYHFWQLAVSMDMSELGLLRHVRIQLVVGHNCCCVLWGHRQRDKDSTGY